VEKIIKQHKKIPIKSRVGSVWRTSCQSMEKIKGFC
jgi:hypothetical protein